jgi:hypothetical protein
LVVKASGLAAGKGVIVADSKQEACKAVSGILEVWLILCLSKLLINVSLFKGQDVWPSRTNRVGRRKTGRSGDFSKVSFLPKFQLYCVMLILGSGFV